MNGDIEDETAQFCINAKESKGKLGKTMNGIYQAFKGNNDREDFLHSIKRFYNKNKGPAAFKPIAAPVDLDDSFTKVVKLALANSQIDHNEMDFCITQHKAKDKKFDMIYKCLQKSGDHKDFIHSVKRFYKKANP